MPNYEYKKPDGTIEEHYFPIGKAPKSIGDAVRIVSATAGVKYIGSGWTKQVTIGSSYPNLYDQ